MADIELVIKIPKEYYEQMKNTPFWWSGMKNCVLNGTPLPKGHGKLIDIEEVDRSLSAHVILSNNSKEDWKHIYEAIEAVPTIIESED